MQSMAMPLASVCIPLYNKASHIAKTLDAVLQQTYPNLEIVISDNGSNDGSTAVAQEYAQRDPRIKYYRLEHTVSINENWRYCYQLAKGEFVNLHSADDHTLKPEFFEQMISPMLDRPEIGFTVCELRAEFGYVLPGFSGQGIVGAFQAITRLIKEILSLSSREERARKLLASASLENHLGTPYAVFCRRACLPLSHWKKVSYYWPESYVDWDFLIRLYLNHRGLFVEGPVFTYHYDENSPYWRILVDNGMDLYDKTYRMMMPLTILTDPELSELRRHAPPDVLQQLFQHFAERLRLVMEKSDDYQSFEDADLVSWSLPRLRQTVDGYRLNPTEGQQLIRLRQLRNGLARHWVKSPGDATAAVFAGPYGEAHRLILTSGIQWLELDSIEQALQAQAYELLAGPTPAAGVLALSLLQNFHRLDPSVVASAPDWLRTSFGG